MQLEVLSLLDKSKGLRCPPLIKKGLVSAGERIEVGLLVKHISPRHSSIGKQALQSKFRVGMDSSLRRLPGQQSWFAAWPDNGFATA